MLAELFGIAFDGLKHRRVRSWLTMVGIFIGIAAVVALISLGQGLNHAISGEFEKIGVDKIIIQPKASFGPPGSSNPNPLTVSDKEAVQKVPGVLQAAGLLIGNARVSYNDQLKFYQVVSLPLNEEGKLIEEMNTYKPKYGRELQQGDKYKVVLGIDFAEKELFGRNVRVGDKILLNDQQFVVVGIWERIGNPGDDRSFTIPEEAFKELFNSTDRQDYIIAKVAVASEVKPIAVQIERALRKNRNLKEGNEDFTVQTLDEYMASFMDILDVVNAVLIGIAAISLVVGGVGIANTMFTAVLERTKEIGIMKAIGARNSHVLLLFLFESGLLGLVGGGIGVLLGMGMSKLVELIGKNVWGTNLLQAYFPWYLIVGALAFSFFIGTLFGILPARQASRQKPVDALRYE
ncbi:MAG: ABC transporter permease [archaeon]